MPQPLTIPEEVYRGEDGRWYKPCHKCGKVQSYLRRNYAIHSFLGKKECKSCSNSNENSNHHKGWVKGVLRMSFANKYKTSAETRGIVWDVTYEYLADLLIEQDFKCAITGWDICAMNICNNASLDRIDSSVGYVEGNLQWVDVMVNMCKGKYSQSEFLDMCSSVYTNMTDKTKW